MRLNKSDLEYYVGLYRKTVFAAALCYVRNSSDAEDISQDVFLKLFTCGMTFESDEHVKAWLIRCTVNRCKSLLRSYWYRFSEPLEKAENETYYDSGQTDGMLKLLRRIRKNNRITLYMYYYEGYSLDEIARILGISANTVSSRLRRGRSQLKRLLLDERNDLGDELQRFF
ncbi:MAG: RNA polymerase sigma factor [Ruminiclostridium sp.]|nr:RNA polymerase sigma factor [Ruminiclostridium sp.]